MRWNVTMYCNKHFDQKTDPEAREKQAKAFGASGQCPSRGRAQKNGDEPRTRLQLGKLFRENEPEGGDAYRNIFLNLLNLAMSLTVSVKV